MQTLKRFLAKIGGFLRRHMKMCILAAIVLVAGIGVLIWQPWRQSVLTPAIQPGDGTYVRTVVLSKGALEETVSATGTVESNDVSNVTTSLNYAVKSVEVQVGDEVAAGDIICVLDSSELTTRLQKAQETLQESIDKAYDTYEDALDDYEEAEDTLDEAEDKVDSKRSAYNTARSAYNTAKSSVSAYQSAYDAAYKAQESAGLTLNSALLDKNSKESAYEAAKKAYEDAQAQQEQTQQPDVENSQSSALDENSESASLNQVSAVSVSASTDTQVEELKAQMEAAQQAYEQSEESYNQAKEEYTSCEQATSSAKEALDTAKKQSNYDTYYSQYTTAQNEYDSAYNAYTSAQTALERAEDTLVTAYENYQNAGESDDIDDINEEIEKCTLRAESAGTVTAVNATVGSRPSETTVATIQNTNTLKVAISIEEYDMQNVEVGMQAIITSDATDVQMHGTVTQISPVASTQGMGSSSSTFSAEVEITDPDENLLIGMNAKVEIIVSSIEDVYTVPYDAVGEDEEGNKVIYVQNAQTQEFEPVVVFIGEENDYYIEISGDTLQDGMVVRASANEEEATESGSSDMSTDAFPGGDINIAMPEGGNMGQGGMPAGGGMPTGGGMMQGGGGRP